VLSFLLNWPHFMASYHLLYTTPGAARKHPYAAKYVPAFLVVYAALAALLFEREPLFFHAFHAAAAMYLAWHYTGQAWGMMAAFARIEQVRFDDASRGLLRANLRVLLAFHVVWSVHIVAAKMGFARYADLYQFAGAAAALSAVLGAMGLARLLRSSGKLPARVVLPWIAIHGWYALLYRHPKALFWVQLAHAAQYLIFPIRVEANREARADGRPPTLEKSLRYYGLLLASGLAAFWGAPRLAAGAAVWAGSALPAGILVADLFNIHHYFVDGCIWKLGDEEVRRDLFAHLGAPGQVVAKSLSPASPSPGTI